MKSPLRLALITTSSAILAACGSLTIQPATTMNAMDTTMGTYRESDADRYILVTMTDAAHEQLVQGERVDREAALPPRYAGFLGNLSRTYGLKRVADWPLGTLGIRCLVFELTDPGKRDATIAALSKERYVESAQRLSMFYASADPVAADRGSYNDPYRNLQHGFTAMQVAESHRWATGKGVKVAVIDTGIDTRHPELRDRVVGIRNFVDRDSDAFNADAHGTAVAGVIAAASNNGLGLVGIAPEADILGLKACWQGGRAASTGQCSSFTLAKALNFAVDQEVDVINLSLGGPADPLLARLVGKAVERNILVVGAANPDSPGGFPAGVDDVIAVENTGAQSASGSAATTNAQTGSPEDAASMQLVSAPGNQVLSAKPHGEYDFYSGSSFSTAHVAGVTALIRQRKPHMSGPFVRELIATTAQSGERTANACRAIARIVAEGECQSSTTMQATRQHGMSVTEAQ